VRLSRFVGVAVLLAVFTGAAAPAEAQFTIQSINLTNLTTDPATGVTTATGTITGLLANAPFTSPFSLVLDPPGQGGGNKCPVLHLAIGPIDINNLLGLYINTTEICVDITAYRNQGLLGSLLCSLSGAGGLLGLNNILNNPTVLSALTDILNQALAQGGGHGGQGCQGVCMGQCQVLDLCLGPIKLNLLGLRVVVDNCSNGPIEVCVSATRTIAGGGVLGDLLCSLTGASLTLQDIAGLIEEFLP